MQNELTTAEVQSLTVEFSAMPSEELLGELTKQLAITADSLIRTAAIIRVLEERGEDLSGLRMGMVNYLRKIAYGQLAPEVVVRFSGSPMLIQRISNFPIDAQRKLASGGAVKMGVWRDTGIEWREVDPLTLTRDQVYQVFAPDHIRTEGEQIAMLETRASKPAKEPGPKRARVRADKDRVGIRIGRNYASLGEVLTALGELRGFETDEQESDDLKQVATKLTEGEYRALRVASAKSDCSMSDMLRRALWAAGLLENRHEDAE